MANFPICCARSFIVRTPYHVFIDVLCYDIAPTLLGLLRSFGRFSKTSTPFICSIFPDETFARRKGLTSDAIRPVIPRTLSRTASLIPGGARNDSRTPEIAANPFTNFPFFRRQSEVSRTKEQPPPAEVNAVEDLHAYLFSRPGSSFENVDKFGGQSPVLPVGLNKKKLEDLYKVSRSLMDDKVLEQLDLKNHEVYLTQPPLTTYPYRTYSETFRFVLSSIWRQLCYDEQVHRGSKLAKELKSFFEDVFRRVQAHMQRPGTKEKEDTLPRGGVSLGYGFMALLFVWSWSPLFSISIVDWKSDDFHINVMEIQYPREKPF